MSGTALAIDKRVVFGVRLAVAVGGKDAIEGVHPVAAGKFILRLLEAEPNAIKRVGSHRVVLRLTIAESRVFVVIDVGEFDGAHRWHIECSGGIISHSEVVLEQSHHAI